MIISTHTLTWSVTQDTPQSDKQEPISTHTLTWSVTSTYRQNRKKRKDFNSHAHVERDAGAGLS